MNVVLINTYELGRQPFGLASPAAWLKARGAAVTCVDLAVQPLDAQALDRLAHAFRQLAGPAGVGHGSDHRQLLAAVAGGHVDVA